MSAQIKDGGPAFPFSGEVPLLSCDAEGKPTGGTLGWEKAYLPGMSLRDWFAGHATEADIERFIPQTSGGCADLFHKLGLGPKPEAQESGAYLVRHDVITKLRYFAKWKHADAMLAAREAHK